MTTNNREEIKTKLEISIWQLGMMRTQIDSLQDMVRTMKKDAHVLELEITSLNNQLNEDN